MPLQRLTAYTVGRFSFLIPVTSATAAPSERLYQRRRLCPPYGAAYNRATLDAGHAGPRYRRLYGDSSTVFSSWAPLHRARFYARFWGIVVPSSGISDAARDRLYSRSIPKNAPDRPKTLQPENGRSPDSFRHSQKSRTIKPYSARESRKGPGDRAYFPHLVAAKVVVTL